ncbi:hypothetical protein [Rothia sp. HMSC067H10]|uniref:hypothetical protein n=1 Tax=Rothia sp. HMSC067H10 TaxID=1739260 RepID=UPI0008A37D6D|nr:hypothetical protein [Rothia sp. HMSC067H10]OFR96728.1 hypothetical protein HMPREF2756_01765 [Rothia sp. HMSC067H10]
MILWDEIINGIIKNFSPIIAAFIAAVIAGVSAYLTWKSYKNSHDATPPELLKYEKWLDIIKKRKEVLDKMPINIKEGKFSKSREESFVRTLELYERNAIWEGEVISTTPVKKYRKCLLRLDPQIALSENILSPGRFSTSPGSYVPAFILVLANIFVSIFSLTVSLTYLIYLPDNNHRTLELFFLVSFLFGIVFAISISISKHTTVSISILHYYKIRERSSLNFPNFISILSRKLYITLNPNSPLFPLADEGSIKVILKGILIFVFTISSIIGICIQAKELYSFYTDFDVDPISLILLSIIFIYMTTCIIYAYVKNEFFSRIILGEYELSALNGKWDFFYQGNEYTVIVGDGEVNIGKFDGGMRIIIASKNLSVHDMKRAAKGKFVNISNTNEIKIKGIYSPKGFSFSILEWKGEEVVLVKK